MLHGQVFFCLSEADLQQVFLVLLKKRSKRSGSDFDDGADVTWIDLLPKTFGVRRQQYQRKTSRRGYGTKPYIVNLSQNFEYGRNSSDLVPVLCTKNSVLWCEEKNRFLLPMEHLGVQGVPIGGCLPQIAEHFLISRAIERHAFSDYQIRFVAGNGMQISCIGAVMLFAFSCPESIF